MKKDFNAALATLEKAAVRLHDEKMEEKEPYLADKDTVEALRKYIFGETDENPIGHIEEMYEQKMEEQRVKASQSAEKEKKNYLGKQKKGVAFVKKLTTEQMK